MNDDVYSYRDGLREGVVFLLLDDKRRVLIECRPDNQGKFTDLFYPSGSIEVTDHKDEQSDYRETALRREVGEEFRNGVKIEHLQYLGICRIPEVGLVFYVYWVASWSGDPGKHKYEDHEPFGELRWMSINEAKSAIPYDSGTQIADMLEAAFRSHCL